MSEVSPIDMVAILEKRKKVAGAAFVLVWGAFICFAGLWSNYRAEAMIEVSLPDVSVSATSGTESALAQKEGLADLRISYLQQKVLSTGSLVDVITKYNLYPKERDRRPIADIADHFKKKIKVELQSGNATQARAVSGQASVIAFKLSVDYNDALLAQQTANELVTKFLDEDLKQRRTQVKETNALLGSQLKVLEGSLREQEKKIADFRESYGDTRPDALAFNQQAATSLMMSLQQIESQITTSIGTQGALRAQLASMDPYTRVTSEGQQLLTPTLQAKALKSEYMMLSAKYGPDHPDVLKVKRQMESLGESGGEGSELSLVRTLLTDVKTKRETLRKTYGDENPEIVALDQQIQEYEKKIAKAPKASSREMVKKDADNPAYLAVAAQLRAAEEQGASLMQQKESLQKEWEKHKAAVVQNPAIEQQMAGLSRDYENAQVRYRQLKAKQLEAQMDAAIEDGRVGRRLEVINPPELPLGTQPSRKAIILAGFLAGLMSAAFAAGARQVLFPAIGGAQHLASIVGAPALVVVPHIASSEDRDLRKQRLLRWSAGALVVGGGALFLFSQFVMPLDVFLSVVSLKLGMG